MSRRDEISARLRQFNGGEQYNVIDVVGEGAYGVVWYSNYNNEQLKYINSLD